jgi:hypothetical protein
MKQSLLIPVNIFHNNDPFTFKCLGKFIAVLMRIKKVIAYNRDLILKWVKVESNFLVLPFCQQFQFINKCQVFPCLFTKNYIFATVTKLNYNVRHRNKS